MFKRLGRWLMPTTIVGGFLLLLTGGIAVAAFVSGFHVIADYTNRVEFCTSCHEMANGPLAELKKSIHFNNRTGVRATCADCHVPHSFFPKLAAKIFAAKDVYHHVAGTIDTPEKFETRRLEMAKRVWAQMEATGSRACLRCHDFQAMALATQGRRAQIKHPVAEKEGKHCINCHKGIVHELPKGYEGD